MNGFISLSSILIFFDIVVDRLSTCDFQHELQSVNNHQNLTLGDAR